MFHPKDYASSCIKLYTKGHYEKAQQVLQESFKSLEPPNHNILLLGNNIGSFYFKQKKYTKTREILSPTLQNMQRQGHLEIH
jgi:hypothetical protein